MTGLARPEVYRRSLLEGMTKCARRTGKALEAGDDLATGWVEHYGDLGTAWHAFMEEYLRTLGGTWDGERGEQQMPTQEAVEVMYEVLARQPFTLPWEALDELRGMVLGFCDLKWVPKLLAQADYEEELRAEIACPDGEVRIFKGTPDVLMLDPPDGLLILDGKSGRGRPRGPRAEPAEGEIVEDRKYLSDLFQGDSYCYLGLRRYPSASKATFREYHVRSRQVRQGTLTRDGMEHVERKLALLMMQVDRAILEGPGSGLWRPRPGRHCNRQCPVAVSCPIPPEMRGDGAIGSREEADLAAETAAKLEGQRTALLAQLKAWVEDPAHPLPLANEHEAYRWEPPTGKGRRFGLWPVDTSTSEGEAA